MTTKKLQQKVLEIIRREDNVRISELKRWMSDIMTVDGDVQLKLPGNLIVFDGLSQDLADVLNPLIRSGKIVLHPPTHLDEFIIKIRTTQDMKLADWPPKVPYDEPHWLPSVMRVHA